MDNSEETSIDTTLCHSHISRFEDVIGSKLDKIRQELEFSLQIYKSSMLTHVLTMDMLVQDLSAARD